MNSKPILFSSPMVRAILDGSKTQTRRVVKPTPPKDASWFGTYHHPDPRPHFWAYGGDALMDFAVPCPYGQPGDQLWVRETFVQGWSINPITDTIMQFDADGNELPLKTWYRATDGHIGWSDDDGWQTNTPWKPSIHMPRAASRITLEITGVRVERLQDISEADSIAEGVENDTDGWRDYLMPTTQCCLSATQSYRTLWESINGPGSWDANPWVWVVSFERVKP